MSRQPQHRFQRPRRRAGLAALVAALMAAAVATMPITPAGASTAPPDACAAAVAFIGHAASDRPEITQAFYRATCSSPLGQITADPNHSAVSVALLPDGQTAVVSLEGGPANGFDHTLVKVNVATHAETLIADSPAQMLGLSVSPAGDAVSYHRDPDPAGVSHAGVYVQRLDGSAPVRVSPDDTLQFGVALYSTSWSHDGSKVAYPENTLSGSQIAYVPASGTQQQVVVAQSSGIQTYDAVAWAPGDQGLLYTDSADGQLHYVTLGTRVDTTLTQLSGIRAFSLAVDQHWTAFLGTYTATSTSIDHLWLGDPSTATTTINATGADTLPSVITSGASDPAPPGFPGGTSPTPTPTVTPTPTATPTPPPANCPTLQFFGVRGSGETSSDHGGFGKTISAMNDRLRALVPGLSSEAIDYPATPVNPSDPTSYVGEYVDSVFVGADKLEARFRQFIASCPHTYVVFAGYSQGVDVVGMVYIERLTDGERRHIAAVNLFGDPEFNPKQVVVDVGDFNPKLSGILVKQLGEDPRKIPSRWAPRVSNYCTAGDPVCGYSKTNLSVCLPLLKLGLCAHQLYAERGWSRQAARFTVQEWKQLPKLK